MFALTDTQETLWWVAVVLGFVVVLVVAALLTILVVMGTHGLQDLFGKYIGPLSIGVIGQPLLTMGLPESVFQPGHPLFSVLMFAGGLINTLLINVLVIPILWWQVRHGPGRR